MDLLAISLRDRLPSEHDAARKKGAEPIKGAWRRQQSGTDLEEYRGLMGRTRSKERAKTTER